MRDGPGFDPWVEILADAVRHNVRELNRLTGCRLMAVAKNNANGIGVREVGPILDQMDEVEGIAVVRVAEALALRDISIGPNTNRKKQRVVWASIGSRYNQCRYLPWRSDP